MQEKYDAAVRGVGFVCGRNLCRSRQFHASIYRGTTVIAKILSQGRLRCARFRAFFMGMEMPIANGESSGPEVKPRKLSGLKKTAFFRVRPTRIADYPSGPEVYPNRTNFGTVASWHRG